MQEVWLIVGDGDDLAHAVDQTNSAQSGGQAAEPRAGALGAGRDRSGNGLGIDVALVGQ